MVVTTQMGLTSVQQTNTAVTYANMDAYAYLVSLHEPGPRPWTAARAPGNKTPAPHAPPRPHPAVPQVQLPKQGFRHANLYNMYIYISIRPAEAG
jgi:hypothetical protein